MNCSRDYPEHTFTKFIYTGDSGASKTTIAQHIFLATFHHHVVVLPIVRYLLTVLLRVYLFTGLDYWTELTFDLILDGLCKLNNNHNMDLSTFLVSEASTTTTNYNNAHMGYCNRANFQMADKRKAFSS